MTKALKLSLVAAAISLISACGNAEQTAVKVELATEADKQSYALGASMGRYLKSNLDTNKDIGIELKHEVILSGIKDAMAGNPQLNEEEIKTIMMAMETQVRERRTQQAKSQGQAFLTENAKREGVVVTDSGLQFEVMTAAEGEKPGPTDKVTVHYHGTLIDGTVFDSSVERGKTISFPLDGVIPGWTEGLQHMSKGAKYKFFIPSELAYGPRSTGKIPAHSALIFEVELFEIEKATQ